MVHLTLDEKVGTPENLEKNVLNQPHEIESAFNLKSLPTVTDAANRLRNLLTHLHRATTKQAVVLVDEYDKPVLHVLEDNEKIRANRDCLMDIYGILKSAQKHIRFVFVTGIKMFSKTSFSSGLNNLDDISLYPPLASICGYTDRDLDTVFAPELEGLDREMIRPWYNGYSWLGEDKLHNPRDILHLFRKRECRTHWFKSRKPGYLYRLLTERKVSPMQLENLVVDAGFVSGFELGEFSHEALLFQSEYLIITKRERQGTHIMYPLNYPNFEVRSSFNAELAENLTKRGREIAEAGNKLIQALGRNDFPAFKMAIQAMLEGIPHAWHASGGLGRYESWYTSLLYMCPRTTPVELQAKEMTSHGRSDMVLLHENQVFVLEFKKYRDRGEPIHLVGMVFGRKQRNLLEIWVETL